MARCAKPSCRDWSARLCLECASSHKGKKKLEMAHILAPSLADSVGCGLVHLSLISPWHDFLLAMTRASDAKV